MPTQPKGQAQAQDGNESSHQNMAIVVARRGGLPDNKPLKRSSSLKKLFTKALLSKNSSFKVLFKHKQKPKTPVEVVQQTTLLLQYLDLNPQADGPKHKEKLAELSSLIFQMKSILFGSGDSEPSADACAQLTKEFFRDSTLRLLIFCLPHLNLEARKDATQVVANLQRQPVNSRLIASDFLEANLDLMDHLMVGPVICTKVKYDWKPIKIIITGKRLYNFGDMVSFIKTKLLYEDPVIALHYGSMLRECIRHQVVAKYVLKSEHMKKFFDYIQLPNFDVAADASATFKELMTRHKSTVAEFLSKNYSWFFAEFNSNLLESTNYITRRQAIKLLGEILLDRSNASVMVRYVSSKDNLRILMNLLRDSSKSIQIDAFHVFKLFVANQNKPPEIVNILVANRSKLLRFFSGFNTEKEDELFEADKAQVVREIVELEATTPINSSGELVPFN